MTAERVLNDVAEYKLCHAFELLKLLQGFALVHLGHIVDLEAVSTFEQGLQVLLHTHCRRKRIRQALQRLAKFRDGGDTDFVPVEKGLTQAMKCFVSLFVLGVFQAACVDQVLQNIAVFGS